MQIDMRNGALVAGAILLIAGAAAAQSTSMNTGTDAVFAKKAAIGGMAEVEMGKVAVQKASNPRVKEFGQRMIDDHSKANAALKSAASQESLQIPSALDGDHKRMVEKFSSMSGSGFDRAYMDDMVEDHEKDVAEFEKQAAAGGGSPVQKFAQETLPTLRDHLKMAREVQKAVGGGVSSHSH